MNVSPTPLQNTGWPGFWRWRLLSLCLQLCGLFHCKLTEPAPAPHQVAFLPSALPVWVVTCLAGAICSIAAILCLSGFRLARVTLFLCCRAGLPVVLCTCCLQAMCPSALEVFAMLPAGNPMLDTRIVWSVANPPRPDFCAADSGSLLPSSSTEAGFGQCRPMSVTQGEPSGSFLAQCVCMGAE